jgi:hypothetical protein
MRNVSRLNPSRTSLPPVEPSDNFRPSVVGHHRTQPRAPCRWLPHLFRIRFPEKRKPSERSERCVFLLSIYIYFSLYLYFSFHNRRFLVGHLRDNCRAFRGLSSTLLMVFALVLRPVHYMNHAAVVFDSHLLFKELQSLF